MKDSMLAMTLVVTATLAVAVMVAVAVVRVFASMPALP